MSSRHRHQISLFTLCVVAIVLESTFALAVTSRSFTVRLSRGRSRNQNTRHLNLPPQKSEPSPLFFRPNNKSKNHDLPPTEGSPTKVLDMSASMGNFSPRMLGLRGGAASLGISKFIKGFLDDIAGSRTKSFAVLILSILIETTASTVSKRARDTSNAGLFLFSVGMNLISICGFCTCLAKIDVGVAYAIWGALGTVIVSSAGIILFNEKATPIKLISILLVILGVVGLNLSDSHS